jgi:hypothetical protein
MKRIFQKLETVTIGNTLRHRMTSNKKCKFPENQILSLATDTSRSSDAETEPGRSGWESGQTGRKKFRLFARPSTL